MEFLKEYPLLLKASNLNRILSGELRLVKNLKKICKNYGKFGENLDRNIREVLAEISEKEFALALLIELVDDSLEYVLYKPNKKDELVNYLGSIIKVYDSIKKHS